MDYFRVMKSCKHCNEEKYIPHVRKGGHGNQLCGKCLKYPRCAGCEIIMSGMWERITNKTSSGSGPNGDVVGRIGINQIEAALVQKGTGMYTAAEIKTKINLRLSKKGHEPLNTEELADFSTLVANLDALPTTTSKLVWLLKLRSMLTDAEMGLCDEAEFRDKMGMPV